MNAFDEGVSKLFEVIKLVKFGKYKKRRQK